MGSGGAHALMQRDQALKDLKKVLEEKEELIMSIARLRASNAIYVQTLAKLARNGQHEWAKAVLKAADEAALSVRREDLVNIQLNTVKEQ